MSDVGEEEERPKVATVTAKTMRMKEKSKRRTLLRMGRNTVNRLGRDATAKADGDADAASNPGPWLECLLFLGKRRGGGGMICSGKE